jgi:hypothetical protein
LVVATSPGCVAYVAHSYRLVEALIAGSF